MQQYYGIRLEIASLNLWDDVFSLSIVHLWFSYLSLIVIFYLVKNFVWSILIVFVFLLLSIVEQELIVKSEHNFQRFTLPSFISTLHLFAGRPLHVRRQFFTISNEIQIDMVTIRTAIACFHFWGVPILLSYWRWRWYVRFFDINTILFKEIECGWHGREKSFWWLQHICSWLGFNRNMSVCSQQQWRRHHNIFSLLSFCFPLPISVTLPLFHSNKMSGNWIGKNAKTIKNKLKIDT